MGTALPNIEQARAENGHALRLKFRGRGVKTVDLSGLIALKKAFSPLHDEKIFAKVKVIDHGAAVAWPDDLDLGASTLWRMAIEQAPFGNEDFVEWQQRVGLSNQEAAAALGCSLSTIKNFRSGAVSISNAVAIACRTMEADATTLAAHYKPRGAGRLKTDAKTGSKTSKKKAA